MRTKLTRDIDAADRGNRLDAVIGGRG